MFDCNFPQYQSHLDRIPTTLFTKQLLCVVNILPMVFGMSTVSVHPHDWFITGNCNPKKKEVLTIGGYLKMHWKNKSRPCISVSCSNKIPLKHNCILEKGRMGRKVYPWGDFRSIIWPILAAPHFTWHRDSCLTNES